KVIERLISYGMTHMDPEPSKLNIHCDKKTNEASVEILFRNTINCVRGVAAEAIGGLLWSHTDWLDRLRPGIASLVNDPHPAVRMASMDALQPVINIDKDLAVAWFCKACENDLRVAASPKAVFFFNYTVASHFEQIAPIIREMVRSPLDDVSQKGATEVAARWLFYEIFGEELAECRKGRIPQRKGIAQVTSNFLNDEKYSVRCQELLLPLFNDPEKDVRAETLKMMRGNIFPNKLAMNSEFLKAYIRSKAFADGPSVIVGNLKDFSGSLIPLAEIIFAVCEVFSTTLKEKSREAGSDVPHTMSQVCSLLLRLYEQAQGANNNKIVNYCMDIWDMLFESRVGMIRQLTSAIEK
ncbi:MAG: HEAT repeat domain-containing protein, partial [Syntrophales bacterium]|nr:HEAT repeat domain-containing protein [Syntrophales bacterium]